MCLIALQDDEEHSLLDSTQDELLKSPTGSIKSSSPETSNSSAPPPKPISLKRNISVPIPTVEASDEPAPAEGESTGDEPSKKVVKLSEMSAQERLELRAKKFGVTSTTAAAAPASTEKLQARAARFGIQSESVSSTTPAAAVADSTSIELLKKRAERFGAVLVPELKKAEEQEKIAKRQERFGITTSSAAAVSATSKATITGPTKTLTEYEEKALKRLERFKTAA